MVINRCISWVKQTSYLQAVLMGGALGVGFVIPQLWWLALVAIVWMLWALETPTSTKKLVSLFVLIWGIKSLCSIVWFWSAYPIDWVPGMSNGVQITLIMMYWLTSGLWLSSGGAIFVVMARWVQRQKYVTRFTALMTLPLLWLVAEISAAVVFSIFTAGAGSFVQAYFSFGMSGYLLGVTPVGVWAAALAGVYGLSALLIGIAVGLYALKQKLSRNRYVGVVALVIILITFLPVSMSVEQADTQTVIAIDTTFNPKLLSQEDGFQIKDETLALAVEAALALNPQAVLLPEDSRYLQGSFGDVNPQQVMSYWQFMTGNSKSILIDSGRYTTPEGKTVLRAHVFDGVSGSLWQFDKQYLVPQGEYVPRAYGAVLRALGYGAMVDAVAIDSSYIPGPLTQSAQLPEYVPGVLFCFESVNPQGAIDLVATRDLPFIAHPISHGWFHHPQVLWRQLDVMLQVQARYSGLPVVSAGNMVSGKLYLPSGRIETGEVVETGERYTLRRFTF